MDPTLAPEAAVIVFEVRLPRALLALAVGASLAVSGTAFQAIFQNPLVSPDILGVSAGAGFGAALAIAASGNAVAVQASAFLCGLVAVALAYGISRQFRVTMVLLLVLAGNRRRIGLRGAHLVGHLHGRPAAQAAGHRLLVAGQPQHRLEP